MVGVLSLLEVASQPVDLDPEEVALDPLIHTLAEHVAVVPERVHALKLRRDGPAGAEYDDMVVCRVEGAGDNLAEEPVARALTVGLPHGAGEEESDLLRRYRVVVDDEPVCVLKLLSVEGGAGDLGCVSRAAGACAFVLYRPVHFRIIGVKTAKT